MTETEKRAENFKRKQTFKFLYWNATNAEAKAETKSSTITAVRT
jgi:hypothetical protein